MNRIVLSLCYVTLWWASPALADEPPAPPPWEAAEPDLSLDGSTEYDRQRLRRYQVVNQIGAPLFLGGLATTSWGLVTISQQGLVPPSTAIATSAGILALGAGAGAIAWGSHNVAMVLHDNAPLPKDILAGRVAYGMLGVGTTALLTAFALPNDLGLAIGLTGYVLIASSGLPALLQMTRNQRFASARVVLCPRADGLQLVLADRF